MAQPVAHFISFAADADSGRDLLLAAHCELPRRLQDMCPAFVALPMGYGTRIVPMTNRSVVTMCIVIEASRCERSQREAVPCHTGISDILRRGRQRLLD